MPLCNPSEIAYPTYNNFEICDILLVSIKIHLILKKQQQNLLLIIYNLSMLHYIIGK